MRVLILTQYFTPEIGATSARVHTFASGLAARGHDVTVCCEVPNHPQGVVRTGYGGRLLIRQQLDGFRGVWLWVHTRPEKTSRGRLAFYGSYAAMAFLFGSLTSRPDVIFASSPPLPVAAAAAALARRHHRPWVLDVRDLWPQAAVALGELTNPRLLRAAEALERFVYRDAARITTVTEPFRQYIRATEEPKGEVVLVPNGTTPLWLESGQWHVPRAEVGLPEREFVWTFAGNLGLAQGLHTALEAAAQLGSGFRLVLLGNGAARPELERLASTLGAENVEFRDQVPVAEAARVMRASNALLVSLAADSTLASFVPSKLYDCCATGRPVIVAAAGEPARLAGGAGAGVVVPPGEADRLADTLRRLRKDADLRTELGKAGRSFAASNLRKKHVGLVECVLRAASDH